MNNRNNIFSNFDWLTVLFYVLIVLFGWINIYSAVFDEAHQSIFDVTQRYGKQMIWIVAAAFLGFLLLLIDARIYENFSFLIYVAVMLLLLGVLVGGKEISGSKSWFQIGSIAIQPAEFAKFATALALAKYLTMPNIDLRKLKYLMRAFIIILTPAALIFLQNDTGTALVFTAFVMVLYREGMTPGLLYFAAAMIVIFLATLIGGKWVVISALAGIGLLLIVLFKKQKNAIITIIVSVLLASGVSYGIEYGFNNFLQPHQQVRIKVLLGQEIDNRGAGYNVHQSKIAIGSGGFTGKGFLQGTQTKYNFVPEQSTDFIFCTVGEEWGFVGSSLLILLFLLLLIRLVLLAERQRSRFSRVYGYSVIMILLFHFAINIGMTVGLVPVIGIPLPYVSYGGSSLWAFTILLFIFLKLDANRRNVLG